MLEDYKVARATCGSSHSIAWTQPAEVLPPQEHQSVTFDAPTDPIGSALVTEQTLPDGLNPEPFSESTMMLKNRPSLTKILLALPNHPARQKAMNYLLSALKIMYARDAVVSALAVEVPALATTKDAVIVSPAAASQTVSKDVETYGESDAVATVSPSVGLDDFTGRLSDGDARMLLDMLKLAVAGRVGDNGKPTLSHVIKGLGQSRQEVREIN